MNWSTWELERFLLYAIAVAGKRYDQTSRCLERFLPPISATDGAPDVTPFDYVRALVQADELLTALRRARFGQYAKLEQAFREVVAARLDLRSCDIAQLESIHGIGPKTARFFILTTRPGARVAVLDTHILRFLREEHGLSAPKATPQSASRYRSLEEAFLRIADDLGLTPKALDTQVWERYSGHTEASDEHA